MQLEETTEETTVLETGFLLIDHLFDNKVFIIEKRIKPDIPKSVIEFSNRARFSSTLIFQVIIPGRRIRAGMATEDVSIVSCTNS